MRFFVKVAMVKISIFIFFIFINACSQNSILTEFNNLDFPISISCSQSRFNDDLCYFYEDKILESIELHNSFLGQDVFEFVVSDEIQAINITFVDYFLNEDGSRNYAISGQTTITAEGIDIGINRENERYQGADYVPCVIMHELGHALGYHGHYEEDGTLMSESADCETEGWYDDFYDWFQEMYK